VEAEQREKLERLARYVSRPQVSVERLSLTAQGQVRYRLKTPYRDGTTDIVLEPVDFIARLAALVPLPRVHLTRYHGVFVSDQSTTLLSFFADRIADDQWGSCSWARPSQKVFCQPWIQPWS
jgi:Putative transposase